jgi:D-3-phosphoglycerate dehydrogenase
MRIVAFDPYASRDGAAGVGFVDRLGDGLAVADVLTLHVPLGAATRHMIGSAELAALPAGAIVINAARGGIVDEAALVAALRSGRLRAAGLDTFTTEPLPADDPLVVDRRIVLSPHAAALTEESLLAMGLATARNALAGLDGTLDPRLVVNPSVLAGASAALAVGG